MKNLFFINDMNNNVIEIINEHDGIYYYQKFQNNVLNISKHSKSIEELVPFNNLIQYGNHELILDMYLKEGLFVKQKVKNNSIVYSNKLFSILDKFLDSYNKTFDYKDYIDHYIKSNPNRNSIDKKFDLVLNGNDTYMACEYIDVYVDHIDIGISTYVKNNSNEYIHFHVLDEIKIYAPEFKNYEYGNELINLIDKIKKYLDRDKFAIDFITESHYNWLKDDGRPSDTKEFLVIRLSSRKCIPLWNIKNLLI